MWTYGIAVVFAALPLRWRTAVTTPRALAAVLGVDLVLSASTNWRHRDRWLLLMPVYTVFNSLVMLTLGLPSYLWMATKSRNVGFIQSRPARRIRSSAPVAGGSSTAMSTRHQATPRLEVPAVEQRPEPSELQAPRALLPSIPSPTPSPSKCPRRSAAARCFRAVPSRTRWVGETTNRPAN